MKKWLLMIVIFMATLSLNGPLVWAEENKQNKVGVHILEASEIDLAAKLVGENGYVTVVIRSDDRNLEKWQTFMDKCHELKLIPIVRLATYPEGENWVKPTIFEPVDFANFLNSLEWPTKERLVIVYNEPNRAQEWGGELNPGEYAYQLSSTIDRLKQLSADFIVMPAGFDAAAPNNHALMDEFVFLRQMQIAVSNIFQKISAWSSHSYPNPAFAQNPWYQNGKMGIRGYQHELTFLQYNFGVSGLPVYITETGWNQEIVGEKAVANYFESAFKEIWTEPYLKAITPFLLTAGAGDFKKFSLTNTNGEPNEVFKRIAAINNK